MEKSWLNTHSLEQTHLLSNTEHASTLIKVICISYLPLEGKLESKDISISSSERPFVSIMKYMANSAEKTETAPKPA